MDIKADLHIHTNFSDGNYSPKEIVEKAKEINLKALAITDHDTLEGIPQAITEGKSLGIEIIPGVELSTSVNDCEVHILGYFLDCQDEDLLKQLNLLKRNRLLRVEKMVKLLNNLGFSISYNRVLELAEKGSVGRPHVAKAMLEKDMATSSREVFQKYIGKGKKAFVPKVLYTPKEAISLIKQSGGVAVFAHPGLAKMDFIIPHLVELGLKGLEVYHPGHFDFMSEHYKKLCQKYNLIATGGSDFHGKEYRSSVYLGDKWVDYEAVLELKKIAKAKI